MVAFGGEVIMPVLIPVTGGADGSELQHHFGSVEKPPGTGDVEPIPTQDAISTGHSARRPTSACGA